MREVIHRVDMARRRLICAFLVWRDGYWNGHDPIRTIEGIDVLSVDLDFHLGRGWVGGHVTRSKVECRRCWERLPHIGSPWSSGPLGLD